MDMEYSSSQPSVVELADTSINAILLPSPDEIVKIICEFDSGDSGIMELPSGEQEGSDHDQP